MKRLLILLCCISVFVNLDAHERMKFRNGPLDSLHYHKVNFCFTWFEMGAGVPLKEKRLKNLPYGMNNYLYGSKGDFAVQFFGLGFFYKHHWGLSVIFLQEDFTVPDAAFKGYISSQFPNYYTDHVQAHTYTLYMINYRLSYRFAKGRFVYTPQFQLGVNDCDDFDNNFVFKEQGSNNFIEYSITKKNLRKNIFTYRVGMMVCWRITKPDWKWNVEPGLRADFMVIPTNFTYTISSKPYNMPATVHEVNVRRMRPAFTITAVLNIFRR